MVYCPGRFFLKVSSTNSFLCPQVARCARVYLLHLQRHARRARHLGAERVPGASASCRITLPLPAGGGAALGCDGGRVRTGHPAVPVGGVSQSDDDRNPGGEVRPGASQTWLARPAAAQLGETTDALSCGCFIKIEIKIKLPLKLKSDRAFCQFLNVNSIKCWQKHNFILCAQLASAPAGLSITEMEIRQFEALYPDTVHQRLLCYFRDPNIIKYAKHTHIHASLFAFL